MPQFSITLPDNVLQADTIASVRAFAERTDWSDLPSSTHLHAGVISVVLRPPDTDTSLAEEALLLLATQRILFYLESPSRSRAVDVHLLYSWIERIERINNAYKDEESDATQLFKNKMHLSIELFEKATSLIHSDKLASEVLYASGSEIGVSADIQAANDSGERMRLALVVAEIAKLHSYNEQTMIPNPSIRSGILRWLAILPGGLLCALIVAFPIHWGVGLIQLFGMSSENSFVSIGDKIPLAAIPPEMLERFGYAFFTPLIMIVSGAHIAPRFKFQTGIALAVLWGIIFVAGMTFVISQGQYSGWGWLRFAITCVLGIAGVCLGLFRVQRKKESGLALQAENKII